MQISNKDWQRYIKRLSAIDKSAVDQMQAWVDQNGFDDMAALIARAYGLATKYGEAAAAITCEMYDAIAVAQSANVPAAIPAESASYWETVKAIEGTMLNQHNTVAKTVGRLVKQAGADTMLQNAARDGAEWAWIPSGDTCAFCLTLASRGWQKASKTVRNGGHAEHIHANCNCQFAIRFDGKSSVEGYDPDALYRQYIDAGDTPKERINAMRRMQYAVDKDSINARKREAYAERRQLDIFEKEREIKKSHIFDVSDAVNTQDYRMSFRGILGNAEVEDKICEESRSILSHRGGTNGEDLVLLDATTGNRIHLNDRSKFADGIDYDELLKKAVEKAHEEGRVIVAIHNHPSGNPPSLDDGSAANVNGYAIGIVIGHDGSIYQYSPAKKMVPLETCKIVHNSIAYQIDTGAKIEDVWYDILQDYGVTIIKRR